MAKQKGNIFFSTITFKGGELSPIVLTKIKQELLHKRYQLYILIEETGAYGKNHHLHLYCEFNGSSKRTDHFTTKIRKFYPNDSISNRYTVRTQIEKDKIFRLGYYFQKETGYLVQCSKNVDLVAYKKAFIERSTTAQKLLVNKNKRLYTLNQLPSVYLAYCDQHKLEKDCFRTNYSKMIRDGLISTLQLGKLRYVTEMVNVLQGSELDSEITYGRDRFFDK